MRQQQGGGGGGGDNSLDFVWTMVFVIALALAIWYFGKDHILMVIIKIRYFELRAMDWIVRGADALHLPVPSTSMGDWIAYFQSDHVQYTVEVAERISDYTGSILRFVTIPLLLLMALKAYVGNVTAKFKTTYQMPTLRKKEIHNWPHNQAVAKLNLVEVDLDQKPWAMAMTPMQFCKSNGLVEAYTKENEPAVRLLRGNAYEVFVSQLGPLWTTIDRQPEHIQVLFAIFAAKGYRDGDAAKQLLRQIAASSGGSKLDFSGARALLKKHFNKPLIARCLGMHAYVTTVMAGMLNLARTDGVLACAEFLWLKKVDRRMWYTLNDVGRQVATPEVGGVFAHYQTEVQLKAALRAPCVDAAVDALQTALDDIKYDPEVPQ